MLEKYYSLYGRLLDHRELETAFKKVRSAKGAAGIDGQSINDFAENLPEEIKRLALELREKSYKPMPVRRVEILKETGGTRKLGIPAVRDRVVQQALLEILQPIYDPAFHPSSYGYRPGRSCHQAIEKATMFIRRYDLQWVVDMDLSRCFDTLDHEIILSAVSKRIKDGSILALIKAFLRSGVMTNEGLKPSETGSPQGGVISPLLANIYLDAFDQHMKARGHRMVRYADDILVLSRTKKAGENALKKASEFLEGELKLTVNQDKTVVVHSSAGVKYLGVVIHTGHTAIQPKKIAAFKEKVKKATRRSLPVNLEKVIKDLNPIVRGFGNYFRIANCKGVFQDLAQWIRRRLRAIQLRLWKKPKRLHRRLRQLGYKGNFKAIKMQSWRNARSPLAHYAMSNKWFDEIGLFNLDAIPTGIHVPI